MVGFGRDPDKNLIEIAETSPTGATYLAAIGIGASDLEQARDFYAERVGLTERQFLGTDRYDEYIMGTPEDIPSCHWCLCTGRTVLIHDIAITKPVCG